MAAAPLITSLIDVYASCSAAGPPGLYHVHMRDEQTALYIRLQPAAAAAGGPQHDAAIAGRVNEQQHEEIQQHMQSLAWAAAEQAVVTIVIRNGGVLPPDVNSGQCEVASSALAAIAQRLHLSPGARIAALQVVVYDMRTGQSSITPATDIRGEDLRALLADALGVGAGTYIVYSAVVHGPASAYRITTGGSLPGIALTRGGVMTDFYGVRWHACTAEELAAQRAALDPQVEAARTSRTDRNLAALVHQFFLRVELPYDHAHPHPLAARIALLARMIDVGDPTATSEIGSVVMAVHAMGPPRDTAAPDVTFLRWGLLVSPAAGWSIGKPRLR